MGVLEKIAAARSTRGRKGFSQPPFWSADQLRLPLLSSTPLRPSEERIENDFAGYVDGMYKANGTVFACILARQWVFSEARFQFRRFIDGRPGDLFGRGTLDLLEHPWPGGTTGELLQRMEQDASLAGNFWATKVGDNGLAGNAARGNLRVAHMRPDRVTMIIGSNSGNPNSVDARVVGALYKAPQAEGFAEEETLLLPGEIVHYSPIPDPLARFRGMSWLTPLIREIEADKLATTHKAKFFENAAVPNLVVKFDKDTSDDDYDEFVEGFNAKHQGAWNAYKTLFLMGGADVTPLTMDFKQLEFSQTQGKGESRIAAAAGVPPSWVGFSEGLQGSSLNAGNFTAARRRFADGTIRPLWRMAAASLQNLVTPPNGAELWYDERDIAFLREDAKDQAEIQGLEARTIRALLDAGWEGKSVVAAVQNRDWSLLRHSGLFSVQLQAPGTEAPRELTELPQEGE